MKLGLFLLAFISFLGNIKAQSYFGDFLIVGTSLTYLRGFKEGDRSTDYEYETYTWNINAGIPMSKRIFTGIQVLNIYDAQITSSKEYYTICGIFSQYNRINSQKKRIFAEISLSKGNFFSPDGEAEKRDHLYYFGFGAGYDHPIRKIPNLYLDFSFINYIILNRIKNKSNFTQYIIGLNYRFGSN